MIITTLLTFLFLFYQKKQKEVALPKQLSKSGSSKNLKSKEEIKRIKGRKKSKELKADLMFSEKSCIMFLYHQYQLTIEKEQC